jgi:hypothetical protein
LYDVLSAQRWIAMLQDYEIREANEARRRAKVRK